MNIEVIDNIVPSKLLLELSKIKFNYTPDRSNNFGVDRFLTCIEYGSYNNVDNHEIRRDNFQHLKVKNIWDWFKNKTNVSINNLESCYINAISFGMESYIHTDGVDIITCIIYLNSDWHSQWSGETVFYSGNYTNNYNDIWYYTHDVVKSVLPRCRRMVVFDGEIPHSVSPLSKKCSALRQTLMFKLKDVDISSIKKGLLSAT